MVVVVLEVLLEQFSKFVAERIGLHFPRERWRDLELDIRSAAKELSFQRQLANSLQELQRRRTLLARRPQQSRK